MAELHGVGASPGIATGPVVALVHEDVTLDQIADPVSAITASGSAVSAQLSALSVSARESGREEAADVLNAQSLIAEDEMIVDAVSEHLDDGADIETAFEKAATQLESMLASIPDPYLAARAADVGEVMRAIKRDLAGATSSTAELAAPSILIAHELTAAETAELDPEMVLGFATEVGGATSHVAIIARSLGVPAVVGVPDLLTASPAAAALDGSTGEFHADPSNEVLDEFADRLTQQSELQARLDTVRGAKVSFGDTRISVSANIASTDDVARAVAEESDGVGLFRTEFLFLDTDTPPTEEEQFEAYKLAASSWDETVVIRTFDIGGDKPAAYLDLPAEENPFLGQRGVRIYDQFSELIDGQLRAALRAAAHGPVAIMVPMVATLDEFRSVKDRAARVKSDLVDGGIECGDVELGVMVEVPSVALNARAFAEEVDFFSIGTNDLTQYTMAADRLLSSLSDLHDPLHPAVIELCRLTAAAGLARGCSTSVCGLAAADPLAAVIFASIGITKLSVSAGSVNLIKATLAAQDPQITDAIDEVLATASSAAQVREALTPLLAQP